jgi:ubiquinone/menaquinone biosynthesis C-methylase UbiE
VRYASNSVVAGELLRLAGRRALDIGCGDGKFTRFLARSGAATTGIDVNPVPLARARTKAAEENLTIEFIEARAEDMPFADARFDVVVFSNSLHHVAPDMMDKALAEAARVLAPGGQLYIMEPVAEGPYFEATRLVNDEREVRNRAREAIGRAAPHGLKAEKEISFQALHAWDSFDDFAAEQAERGERRRKILAERGAEIRALFEGAARRENGKLAFDQVFRVNLFSRAG